MKKNYLYLSFVLYLIFIILTFLIVTDNSFVKHIDQQTFNVLNNVSHHYTKLFAIISILGAPKTITCLTVIMLLFLKNNQQRIFLLCSVLGNNLLNQVFKFTIQRPRPNIEHLTAASGFSFPSGHAMATASFVLAICFIYSQITHKKLFFCLNSIFFCLILISRPILHVHYLSDVVAGSLLASANVLLFYYFFGNRVKYNHS